MITEKPAPCPWVHSVGFRCNREAGHKGEHWPVKQRPPLVRDEPTEARPKAPALSPEEERELRETAHMTLKEMRVPWACGGGDHGPYCDAIYRTLCTERLARHQAVAEERAKWEPYVRHKPDCETMLQLYPNSVSVTCFCDLDKTRGAR